MWKNSLGPSRLGLEYNDTQMASCPHGDFMDEQMYYLCRVLRDPFSSKIAVES